MTPADPFVLARSCAEPDQGFPSLSKLAASIVRIARAGGGDRFIHLAEAAVTRGMLPGGRAVSVHLGRAFLGYAFIGEEHSVEDLRAAVILADPLWRAAA